MENLLFNKILSSNKRIQPCFGQRSRSVVRKRLSAFAFLIGNKRNFWYNWKVCYRILTSRQGNVASICPWQLDNQTTRPSFAPKQLKNQTGWHLRAPIESVSKLKLSFHHTLTILLAWKPLAEQIFYVCVAFRQKENRIVFLLKQFRKPTLNNLASSISSGLAFLFSRSNILPKLTTDLQM